MLLIGNYKLKPSVMSNMYKKTIASLVSIWINWNNYTLFFNVKSCKLDRMQYGVSTEN